MDDENAPLQYRKLPTDCKRQIIIHYTLDLSLATFSPPLLVLSSCGGVLHGGSHHAIVCSSTGIAYRDVRPRRAWRCCCCCCEYRHLPLLAVLLRVAPCFTCLLVDLVLSYKPLYLERGQWVCTLWCGGSLGLCQVYVPEE